jgi:hypothetical protein
MAPLQRNSMSTNTCRSFAAKTVQWSRPSRPCEEMYTINDECTTCINFDGGSEFTEQSYPDCGDDCQSYEFQRTCVCQSQWLDKASGCLQCYEHHGGSENKFITNFQWTGLPKLFKGYCDPLVDPTAGFNDYLDQLVTTAEVTSTAKFSDSLFKQTEVSLYYVPISSIPDPWSITLSTITEWSSDAIKSYLSMDSTEITPATNEYTSRPVSTSGPVPTTSGPIITVINPTIVIQPVWPSTTTSSPSLYSESNASTKDGASVGMLVGTLGALVVVGML